MDSEGIWKACTIKVMTKTAMTTVASSDCSELSLSAGGRFSVTSMVGWRDAHWRLPVAFGRCRSTRRVHGAEIFQHLAGGVLLRILLGRTFGPADELGFAAMSGGCKRASTVKVLLCSGPRSFTRRKRAGVFRWPAVFPAGRTCNRSPAGCCLATHPLQFRDHDDSQHQPARRLQSAIQINGCQHGLQRIHQQGGLVAASAFFFAPPQAQIVPSSSSCATRIRCFSLTRCARSLESSPSRKLGSG